MSQPKGFEPPAYPYDRLDGLAVAAALMPGGMVDLSIGTPCDPPPPAVTKALADSPGVPGYPSATGSAALLDASRGWLERRFGVSVERSQVAACIGTKELVAGMPHWLRLRRPELDTVLYPDLAYPTYEMGAILAGCRPVGVPRLACGGLDLASISEEDAARALCLWVNSPANPSGELSDLEAAATWGRARGVPVLSDECYAEYTWSGPPRTILEHGSDGVLAVHSISKRSNCAGVRIGFYAGDGDLVHYLGELRRHAGFMAPGPCQAAGTAALSDDAHVEVQRRRYFERMELLAEALNKVGIAAELPQGAFYMWVRAPEDLPDAAPLPDGTALSGADWQLAAVLAERAGTLVSPGELYGQAGRGFVRIALVQPTERIELVASRLVEAGPVSVTGR